MNRKRQYPEAHCIWVDDIDTFSCPRIGSQNILKKKIEKSTYIWFSVLAMKEKMLINQLRK
jgi:predicted DNA-binding transcriptional regulator YafY